MAGMVNIHRKRYSYYYALALKADARQANNLMGCEHRNERY